ncbi:hypothetical protein KKA13_01760 [Patescibacteria group bacterium]|nr:hypothetical protein [Patescibacteria group bacterium]
MKNMDYLWKSFLHAMGVFAYVSFVSWFLFNGEKFFGRASNFLMPLLLLLIFVISAVITGLLVLGKPVLLYWDGRKKDAIYFLSATLGWLIVLAMILAIFLLVG